MQISFMIITFYSIMPESADCSILENYYKAMNCHWNIIVFFPEVCITAQEGLIVNVWYFTAKTEKNKIFFMTC